MSKRKLNLDELRVESFITSFEPDHDGTVKGGEFGIKTKDFNWCHMVKSLYVSDCLTKTIESIAYPCEVITITKTITDPGPRY